MYKTTTLLLVLLAFSSCGDQEATPDTTEQQDVGERIMGQLEKLGAHKTAVIEGFRSSIDGIDLDALNERGQSLAGAARESFMNKIAELGEKKAIALAAVQGIVTGGKEKWTDLVAKAQSSVSELLRSYRAAEESLPK